MRNVNILHDASSQRFRFFERECQAYSVYKVDAAAKKERIFLYTFFTSAVLCLMTLVFLHMVESYVKPSWVSWFALVADLLFSSYAVFLLASSHGFLTALSIYMRTEDIPMRAWAAAEAIQRRRQLPALYSKYVHARIRADLVKDDPSLS